MAIITTMKPNINPAMTSSVTTTGSSPPSGAGVVGVVGSTTGVCGCGEGGGGDGGDGGEGGEEGGGGGCLGVGEGGGGGVEGGEGAQHLVDELPVSISKYRGPSSAQPASPNGVAQSGHGHVSSLGMHEPPVDAQQYVPVAHRPLHEVASAAVVQAVAQRGYASAAPVSSSVSQYWMGTSSSMSWLLLLQKLAHVTAQPLNVGLVSSWSPAAPCALLKAGCAFILDTTVVSSECAPHTGGVLGGDGGEGGDAGGGGGGDKGGVGGGFEGESSVAWSGQSPPCCAPAKLSGMKYIVRTARKKCVWEEPSGLAALASVRMTKSGQ